ncbi:podocalyxin-like protein 2 isoform X3 [Sinocyclocheilus anshuiensis]|uniref:podocalyxin-like protein 2 isoform X3 n=1 Tax=Sinocyclocheilus anshuiensis TaxID=1608454 RepID=UPI0007B91E01|nr:PREDICTED: podocalyxin-like protein 2 isoform X3 [Sinocyclocheilus anshuiensis]
MSVPSVQSLMLGSVFLVLVCAEVLSAGPALLPNPLRSHGPVLDVPEGFKEHDEVSRDRRPGFMESSQESSGFFSEDSEDGKNAQIETKDSGVDLSAMNDYSPSSPEPPSSPLSLSQKPIVTNLSSSLFVPTTESVDPERWESDSESSGFPLHPSPGPSVAGAQDHAHSTATPRLLGLARQNQPEATAGPDRRLTSDDPFDDERGREVTQAPTAPEIGPLPSREPLQPDKPHLDDSEEEEDEEELVVFPTALDEEEEDEWRYLTPLTTGPSSSPTSDLPPVVFTETAWQGTPLTTTEDEEGAELRHGGTEYLAETELHDSELSQEAEQVICVDWSNLAGKGYVILNMTDNFDCDEFRMESGDRLLEMLENTFSRKMNIPQGSWLIFLSKPTQQDHQLLMALASEQEIIPPKDVLPMLGEIRSGLYEIGIQNYSTVNTCHSRPSQTRSDYGKLFVVLVIIGSVCVLIIASGIIYICWQRRLPKLKNMSRGEELNFVENGCHDNPTLDVTSDSQSEMQEKKHSANGVAAGGDGGNGWQVLVNKPGKDEEDNQEEDTHL